MTAKNFNLGPSLLLIIPTHNRTKKLARTLNFIAYQQKFLSYQFIIHLLDSSDVKKFCENKNTVGRLKGIFEVVHHNYLGQDIYEKAKHFFSNYLIGKNDHFCIIGDDDLLNLESLYESHNFLNRYNDYVSANGSIYTADFSKDCAGELNFYKQRGFEQEDSTERLCSHLNDYTTNFYSVFRANKIAKLYLTSFDLEIGRSLRERLLSASVIIFGKRKILNSTFLIRDKSGKTGYDEDGNRTLNDDPNSSNYIQTLTFGYNKYESILLSWLGKDSDTSKIVEALKKDLNNFNKKKLIERFYFSFIKKIFIFIKNIFFPQQIRTIRKDKFINQALDYIAKPQRYN